MNAYRTKAIPIKGTDEKERMQKARSFYRSVVRTARRRPYVRSAYFRKEKIFLGLFWAHLERKNTRDRMRRVRLLPCAIEVLTHSRIRPERRKNPNKPAERLYRFQGIAPDGTTFVVQIVERDKSKHFISVFPAF